MKIAPLAQASNIAGVSLTGATDHIASPERMARAKMIASGQIIPAEQPAEVRKDPQAEAVKKIKMRTQRSTNRHEFQEEPVIEQPVDNATVDTNEPAQQTEETRPLSPQFAALARQKRALQIERAEVAKMKAEVEASKQGVNLDEYVSKADLKTNPLKIFETGVTYDQLTEAILANPNNQNLDTKTIDALVEKKLNERLEKEFGTRDSAQEQQVLANIKIDVDSLVKDNENFELIQGEAAQQEVVGLIHRTFKKGWPEQNLPAGTLLKTEQAAQFVEDFLLDQAIRPTTYKKVQSRLTPQQEIQAAAQTPARPGVQVMRTLTNRVSNTQAPLDKRARALAAFSGTLKR
jgi:hypothetical protein